MRVTNYQWFFLFWGISTPVCCQPLYSLLNPECNATPTTVSEIQLLAAIVYGEASAKINSYEEKAAIANAIIHKRNALHYKTVNELIIQQPGYSAAASNKVIRYRLVMCSRLESDYPELYDIAKNALSVYGYDYAEGACFWDGKDLKTLGNHHIRYKKGYRITHPNHNVLSVNPPPPGNFSAPYGRYDYTYESTAGYGETIFWKYTQDFIKARRGTQCN